MPEIFRGILLVGVAFLLMVMQINISQQNRAVKYLKEDLEVAVHDAALQIDVMAMSEGHIVFEQDKALEVFKETFERNTNLTSNDYNIVEVAYIDDTTVSSFPHTYESPNYDFKDTFFYPTMLVIVETETQKFFRMSNQEQIIRRVASYTYN